MRRVAITTVTLAAPVAVVLVLAFGLAACGDEAPVPLATETVTVTATPTAEPTEEPAGEMTVSVYLLRGERLGVAHRTVPASVAVATAAANALLAGPNAREKAAGLTTAIPAGTALNGIDIDDRVARVDLGEEFASGGGSRSLQARVAQVVYTVTQFRSVKAVEFLLDGESVQALGGEGLMLDGPQRRADWEVMLPAIFVETPAVGDVVGGPMQNQLTLKGSAMVFEATFVAEVLDAGGDVLATKTVTAARGAPQRGAFRATVDFVATSRKGSLRVYEVSMEDGSRINVVTIPLRFLTSD